MGTLCFRWATSRHLIFTNRSYGKAILLRRALGQDLSAEPPKTSLLITVHPQHVRKKALESMDIVIAVGKNPTRRFATSVVPLESMSHNLSP